MTLVQLWADELRDLRTYRLSTLQTAYLLVIISQSKRMLTPNKQTIAKNSKPGSENMLHMQHRW